MPAVDPSQACAGRNPDGDWNDPDAEAGRSTYPLGVDVATADGKRVQIVVSDSPQCLQAVSSDGGRVQVPPGTAKRLYDLVGKGK